MVMVSRKHKLGTVDWPKSNPGLGIRLTNFD